LIRAVIGVLLDSPLCAEPYLPNHRGARNQDMGGGAMKVDMTVVISVYNEPALTGHAGD